MGLNFVASSDDSTDNHTRRGQSPKNSQAGNQNVGDLWDKGNNTWKSKADLLAEHNLPTTRPQRAKTATMKQI